MCEFQKTKFVTESRSEKYCWRERLRHASAWMLYQDLGSDVPVTAFAVESALPANSFFGEHLRTVDAMASAQCQMGCTTGHSGVHNCVRPCK